MGIKKFFNGWIFSLKSRQADRWIRISDTLIYIYIIQYYAKGFHVKWKVTYSLPCLILIQNFVFEIKVGNSNQSEKRTLWVSESICRKGIVRQAEWQN